MIDRSFIGHELGSHTVKIEMGRLKFFNKVIGQTNPIFFDEEAAELANYTNCPVCPSYYFSLDLEQENSFGWLEMLGIDVSKILHGMQDFTYHKPAYANQTVTLTAKITDIYDKKAGTLEFVEKEVVVIDEAGNLLATQKITIVVLN